MEGNALARGLSPGTFKHWKRKTVLFLSGQTVSLFGSSWYNSQSSGILRCPRNRAAL